MGLEKVQEVWSIDKSDDKVQKIAAVETKGDGRISKVEIEFEPKVSSLC